MTTSPLNSSERLAYQYKLDRAKKLSAAQKRAENNYTGADGIVRFVREILNADPTPYQVDILKTFVERKRVAVRAPHGAGKTALSSWVVLWAILAFDTDVKVITTASAWRQVEFFTWPEIRLWASRAEWGKAGMVMRPGQELLSLSIKAGNKQAFAVASDNAAFIEGAHASRLVYVFDEAKAIPNEIWDAAEGAFSTAGSDTGNEAYALAISTPGTPSGRFYDICTRKPGYADWATRHIKLSEAIEAKRISADWVQARKDQWGESSGVYQNRVEGEFADTGEDNVIPLGWVELANERWRIQQGKGSGLVAYGIDPAYKGEDKTTIAKLVGSVIEELAYYSKQSPMQTVGKLTSHVDQLTPIAVDVIGIGAGVYDRFVELGYQAYGVNVSHKTSLTDRTGKHKFVNLRSALWWGLRDALDPDGSILVALPPDDVLTGDLTAPMWWYTSNGQTVVESKDDIRERIGRSTDAADAVALALYTDMLRIPEKW